MVKKKIALVFCMMMILTGCRKHNTIPIKMVTQISVTGAHHWATEERVFYNTESIRPILMAMRVTGQKFRPLADPETLDAPQIAVTMVYADGQRHRLRLKSDCYIQEDDGPWQQVDPQHLAPLHYLLYFMPSDNDPRSAFPHGQAHNTESRQHLPAFSVFQNRRMIDTIIRL